MSAVDPPSLVLAEPRGAALVLTLNRPEAKNALSGELVAALDDALARAADDARIRGLVLTGAGPDFCAGADLKALQALSTRTHEENLADSRRLAKLLHDLRLHPKPIVAAVRGHALAGGAGLACACDRVVAAEDARFGFTEARIGFVAAVVAAFVIERTGPRIARELLLTARRVDAPAALALGLADELAPADSVVDRAIAWIGELAPCAPGSLAATRLLLAGLAGKTLHEALEFAAELNARTRATADCREGVAAFLEKRKPKWLAEP
jgi:methylglutaconyl-CoA hydratase